MRVAEVEEVTDKVRDHLMAAAEDPVPGSEMVAEQVKVEVTL